jgi:hypothetical protein
MVYFGTKSRDGAIRIVTSLRLDNRGTIVRLPTEVRNFSPLRRAHTGSGSHPAFCSASTWDYFRRSTAADARSWTTPPSADIKYAWSYTSTPSFAFMACIATTLPYYYYRYSALGPVWSETRAQSGDWYSSGTLHPGQVIRGRLPLLSPTLPYTI